VGPITHPDGFTLLERDVINVCRWAQRLGVACDAGEVFAEVVAEVF
jgi:serine/threonine-protein kinase RIO1